MSSIMHFAPNAPFEALWSNTQDTMTWIQEQSLIIVLVHVLKVHGGSSYDMGGRNDLVSWFVFILKTKPS